MSDFPRLNNWSVWKDPFRVPELGGASIQGEVYGHIHYPNGTKIKVSTPESYDHSTRTLKTYSGSIYILGDPDPKWFQWMRDNNIDFNPDNPIENIF